MTREGGEELTTGSIPDLRRLCPESRDQAYAIGAESGRAHPCCRLLKSGEELTTHRVPHVRCPVWTHRDQVYALGAEGGRDHCP